MDTSSHAGQRGSCGSLGGRHDGGPPMRGTMMLADYAQIADGKLFISGGGWTTCGPGPTPCAVVAIFHVPWDETDQKVNFMLRLVDEDGHGVMQPGNTDNMPVQVAGAFEARRQPG